MCVVGILGAVLKGVPGDLELDKLFGGRSGW